MLNIFPFHVVCFFSLNIPFLLNKAFVLCMSSCQPLSHPTLQAVFFLLLQDMSSLMHTIYDVVDASVNHSCHNKSKTLRVKLTVTPEPKCHRRDTGTGKKKKLVFYNRLNLGSPYAGSQ